MLGINSNGRISHNYNSGIQRDNSVHPPAKLTSAISKAKVSESDSMGKLVWAVCLTLILQMAAVSTERVKVEITPATSTVILPVGETLQLNCTGDPESNLTWYKDGTRVPLDKDVHLTISVGKQDKGTGDSDNNVSILTNRRVDVEDGGTYLCSDQNSEASVVVLIVTVDTKDDLFEYRHSAAISCSVEISPPDRGNYAAVVTWQKNGTKLSDDKKFTEHDNGTLEFQPVVTTREDAGVYQCVIGVGSGDDQQDGTRTFSLTETAVLYAKPLVVPFKRSENLEQEETLQLRCRVLGYPRPNITWTKDDVEIKPQEDGSRYQFSEYNGFPNAQLVLESVTSDDVGEYKCVAMASHVMFGCETSADERTTCETSAVASNYSAILLRVRGNLLFLWPLLGIVAEVVILFLIICISGKMRGKDDPSEQPIGGNPEGAARARQEGSVRHRRSTNTSQT
ncbi:hypothetical protein BaRGS_00021956 [Batillaria attramentaria]|uniref:Ig-like domain-containing protein n=1 Tax=Batillaria attramentaria TaxID=370345 RepID=A0ABD0KI15_9CAEN